MNSAIWKFVELVSRYHKRDPVVEYGSKQVPWQQGGKTDFRELFPGVSFTGCDLVEGLGVDKVDDFCSSVYMADLVGTLIACETLEHCARPWDAVREAGRILSPDGLFILTVPFCHPVHHMPDYWRFTPQAIEMLLVNQKFYQVVYYQGSLALPRTVYALATKKKEVLESVVLGIESCFGELPGKEPGESIYKWTGMRDYAHMRRDNPEKELQLEKQFGF